MAVELALPRGGVGDRYVRASRVVRDRLDRHRRCCRLLGCLRARGRRPGRIHCLFHGHDLRVAAADSCLVQPVGRSRLPLARPLHRRALAECNSPALRPPGHRCIAGGRGDASPVGFPQVGVLALSGRRPGWINAGNRNRAGLDREGAPAGSAPDPDNLRDSGDGLPRRPQARSEAQALRFRTPVCTAVRAHLGDGGDAPLDRGWRRSGCRALGVGGGGRRTLAVLR